MTQPAGWYTNPDGTASERYWDGTRWTHDVRALPPPPDVGGAVAGQPSVLDPQVAGTDVTDPSRTDPFEPDPAAPATGDLSRFDRTARVEGVAGIGAPAADPAPTPTSPGPGPIPGTPGESAADSGSGSVSDLLGLLVDFGFERSFTPATARTGYRIGAVAIVAVAVLFLLGGIQGGGGAAVITLLMAPLLAVLWLVALRAVLQVASRSGQRPEDATDPSAEGSASGGNPVGSG